MIFLESSRLYRSIKEEVPEGEYTIPLGKARVVREGSAVTLLAWGSMLHRTLQAIEDIDAEVIDLMTLKPFDEETILKSVKRQGVLSLSTKLRRHADSALSFQQQSQRMQCFISRRLLSESRATTLSFLSQNLKTFTFLHLQG